VDSGNDIYQAGKLPKWGNGGGIELSPYEHILNYYERLQSAYGWTISEIDESDLEVLLDQMVILSKRNHKQTYIEDVMG
jgi:hypothetical protein